MTFRHTGEAHWAELNRASALGSLTAPAPKVKVKVKVRRAGGAAPPSVNLGPPHISETITARKFKFYIHLDGAKYSFDV